MVRPVRRQFWCCLSVVLVLVSACGVQCLNVATLSSAQYLGCFADSSSHVLKHEVTGSFTAQTCQQAAVANGGTLFGLEAAGQCFYDTSMTFSLSTGCNDACQADPSQRCGGDLAIDVWEVSNSPIQPTVLPYAQYLGCFLDSSNRVLSNAPNPNNYYTAQSCQALAMSNGAKYFGVEDGSQCFYGNSLASSTVTPTTCNSTCSVDRTQRCGGVWALDVYAVTQPATLSAKYLGCFVDDSYARALTTDPHVINPDDRNAFYTAQTCETLAKSNGAKYFGVEYGGQCFYGASFTNYGSSNQCNLACTADFAQRCGGSFAIDVWQNA